ncbi:matrixin family metalloprotease [Rubripirellula reticaptiva]|uniref:Matrixin n=1 Tax=Rubripirellula reticaptiva TaxID=2528013 RepID=A0A5C6EIM6_9BACT|nr:matrixin family metalloprotease [Rubripirellula reticaptiva]TWU48354.1 Matrixin [Rubripirellula reticaptiva]
MVRRSTKKRRLTLQLLETRRVLAASMGWDGPGLGGAELTYHIANSPDSLTQAETNAAIETALAAWSSAADITFTPTSQSGLRDSIDISFVNIDGVAGTLAQAYFPDDVNPARIAGDIQFDISEAWEVGNSLGSSAFDLVYVAVHELGHSLGLDHAMTAASVLTPYVTPNQFFTSLSNVDAAAIASLYAVSDGTETTSDDDITAVDDTVDQDTTTDNTDNTNTNTDPGDSDDVPFPRNRWRRGGNWHRFGGRLDAELVDFNYINPTDVNGDSNTSALDALMIINQLSRSSTIDLTEIETPGLGDVNGDGSVTALDALTVINAMSGNASLTTITVDTDTEADTDTVDETDTTDVVDDTTDETVDEIDDTVTEDTGTVDEVVDTTDETTGETDDDTTDETVDPIDDGGVLEESDDTDTDAEGTDDSHCGDERSSHFVGMAFNLGRFGGDAEALVTRLDTNDDASLSEDEVSRRLWAKLTELNVDADADGLVTVAELDAAVAAAKLEAFTAQDADADGLLTESEVSDRFWSKVSAADVDADGGVSFEELDTFLTENQSTEVGASGRSHGRHPSHHDLSPRESVFASIGRRGRR